MALNMNTVTQALASALQGNTALRSMIGDPVRLGVFVQRDWQFPFVRVDYFPAGYLTGTIRGPGVNWIDRLAVRFLAFSKETSLTLVNGIRHAIYETMTDAPSLSFAGGAIGTSRPIHQHSYFDTESKTAVSSIEFLLTVEQKPS